MIPSPFFFEIGPVALRNSKYTSHTLSLYEVFTPLYSFWLLCEGDGDVVPQNQPPRSEFVCSLLTDCLPGR